MLGRLGLAGLLLANGSAHDADPVLLLPAMAKLGKASFETIAAAEGDTAKGMSARMQANPMNFPTLTDFWCAYELTDRPRVPALLIDDMQVEYEPYLRGIVPQVKLLVDAFRRQGLPIFWSTWWRFGPDDGYFNAMDRFYGPIGARTAGNALYNHNLTNGGDVLSVVAPVTEEERRRVMHKSYSLSMFDERPMQWLEPAGQGTLDTELQKLGVDTIVQVGAWTDDCIISTAFHGFSLQYDVVVVEDGVSTASKQHFNAIEVMRGAVGKVMLAAEVADYIDRGLPVLVPKPREKSLGGRAAASALPSLASARPIERAEPVEQAALPRGVPGEAKLEWLPMVLLALTGPGCFAAGWLLRGRVEGDRRAAASPSLLA